MTAVPATPSRADILEDFATGDLDAGRLHQFVARFPAMEADFRAIAAEFVQLAQTDIPASDARADAPLVDRAALSLADLHRDLAEARGHVDVFAARTPAEIRTIARQLALPAPLMDKLKNRMVDLATIPGGFVAWLANGFGVPDADMRFTLGRPAMAVGAGSFVVDASPGSSKQSFDAAILTTPMSEEDRSRMLQFSIAAD
ncbi:hypothetical protein U1769_14165 [Sphingomonas sp. ZT3P38]|uniref:hypothetical protein n=1 Tax=Parasphingomonas zepuensis TaxID=3096161 RepID=UPI002FCB691D